MSTSTCLPDDAGDEWFFSDSIASSTVVHKYLSSDTLEKPRHSGSLLAGIHVYSVTSQ
jgi:hypothetical protein